METVDLERSVLSETKSSAAPVVLPGPGVLTVAVSLGVLLVCALAWGFLWQRAIHLDTNQGEGPAFALLSLIPSWLAWQQWRGTFRLHERAANDAGNWLVGIAAVLGACLAAVPMLAATPLTLAWLQLLGGWCLAAAGGGYLNLAWARRLRQSGWNEAEHGTMAIGWRFSIADMIVWTLLAAGATASYLHFDRQASKPRLVSGFSVKVSTGKTG